MKIVSLRITNFLGIGDRPPLDIKSLGKTVLVTGKNGKGKTSVLKAIKEALKSSGVDPTVIHRGKDRAEIFMELTDGTSVKRTITPTSNRVQVRKGDIDISSPQRFLDSLRGQLSVNPIEFFLAKRPEQRTIILQAIPMRLSEEQLHNLVGDFPEGFVLPPVDFKRHGLEILEVVRKAVYETRHGENQNVTRLEKAIEQDQRELPDGFDFSLYTDEGLKEKREAVKLAQWVISKHNAKERGLEYLVQRYEDIQEEIKALEAQLQRKKQELEEIEKQGVTLRTELKEAEPKLPKVLILEAELSDYEGNWELSHKRRDIQHRSEELGAVKTRADQLDALHTNLAQDVPRRLLAEAPLPVENLQIEGENIFVNGTELSKLSGREQIDFSSELAMATAGDLHVLCVDGIEQLDSESLTAFQEKMAESDFQCVVARVSDGELEIGDRLK